VASLDESSTGVLRSYFSPSPSQRAWAAAGFAVLFLIAVMAFTNLHEIYAAQKDFVVGSLLSLVGFCFGKAFSRTEERRAMELIRTTPTPDVTALLDAETTGRLHRDGVFRQLAVLARSAAAAQDRLSEYYDSQCRQLDFYRHELLLRIVLDDLARVGAGVADLSEILRIAPTEPRYTLMSGVRLALTGVQRDLREAIGRRDQAYEWYLSRLGVDAAEAWDMFAVMSSDMLKAGRSLDTLVAQYLPYPPRELTHTIIGYLDAASRRAGEFERAAAARQVDKPKIFEVMTADLTAAIKVLEQVERELTAMADAEPTAAGVA
jgi:hypothetical protein